MKSKTGNGRQLFEILCAIVIFAACAVIFLRLFAGASVAAELSYDMNLAVIKGQSICEVLRAADEIDEELLASLGFASAGGPHTYYANFDEDFNLVKAGGKFNIVLVASDMFANINSAKITIRRTTDYPFMNKDRAILFETQIKSYIEK